MEHIVFMKEAFAEAQKAYKIGEVPIGCVIVHEEEIIGRGFNRRATAKNVLCHAEIIAIDQACESLKDWRLENCRLYVTVEPCAMCAGAILQARIPILVYGAKSPKAGCAGSIFNLLDEPRFNHRAEIVAGIYEDACAELMKSFFSEFRLLQQLDEP